MLGSKAFLMMARGLRCFVSLACRAKAPRDSPPSESALQVSRPLASSLGTVQTTVRLQCTAII